MIDIKIMLFLTVLPCSLVGWLVPPFSMNPKVEALMFLTNVSI